MSNELDRGMETKLRAVLGHLETLAPDPPSLPSRSEVGSPRVWPSALKVAMAFAVPFLLAVPALVWLGSSNPDTRGSTTGLAPTEFVTSIPEGEILLATSADWQLFGFVTPDGVPCLRGAPFTDASYCASPELWAIPGVFNWQGTWGLSGQAWVYGFIRDDVTQLEFHFQREGSPDPADAGSLFTAGPQPDIGWAIYVLEFNVDTHGLFTVVTAYGDNGVVLGTYDLRDECDVGSSEALKTDERLRELCAP